MKDRKTSDQFMRNLVDQLIEQMFDSQLVDVRDRVELEIIKRRGYKDGRSAGGWVFDGNTPPEAIEAVHQGILDGDPLILDNLPQPQLGGEFADHKTWEDVLRDEDITIDEDGNTVLYDAYCESFSSGVEDEVFSFGEESKKAPSNEQLIIERYAGIEGQMLVRRIEPADPARDGRLLRLVYQPESSTWASAPIPRPQ